MKDPINDRERVERLADEFVNRYRAGEEPLVEEYARAHPQYAAEILDLFPALIMMEDLATSDTSLGVRQSPGQVSAKCDRPQQVGDYRILREIGRGGMGIVYEAEQLSLGRRVALKLLLMQPVKDPAAVERFRREARAAAKLHHTNIVPVFEVGQDQDVCYYAMQLIIGQGLDEVLKELARLHGQQSLKNSRNVPSATLDHGTTEAREIANSLWNGKLQPDDLGASAPAALVKTTTEAGAMEPIGNGVP